MPENLSSLIALNAEAQSENIHAEESELLTATTEKNPWYRKFFAVPTLAYTMGALVLLFAGIGVFTVLQKDSLNSQVSQMSEKQIGGKGMASDSEARTQEVYSNSMSNSATASNQMSTNSAANPPSSAVTNSPAPMSANANVTIARREAEKDLADDRKRIESPVAKNDRAVTEDSTVVGAPPPPPAPPPSTVDGQDKALQPEPTPALESPEKPVMSVRQMPAPTAKLRRAEQADELKSKSESDSETTVIGGKTFKRANSIWVDAAYRGQSTTKISRGTNEYKKLDSGLRGIVENLGGTVIIVWKEKAYRIQ